MSRKLLIGFLVIVLLFEVGMTVLCFFARETMLQKLGVGVNADTDSLGYLVAWFLLFVSLVCGLALWRVIKNGDYSTLCYLLGLWWIGIGIGIYVVLKRPNNLLSDSLKGALVIVLTWYSKRGKLQA